MGEGDTPGYPMRENAEVVSENGKTLKLQMPRNHNRVTQTSLDLLKSWRGNCDIQILIYRSSPKNIDVREISKVTDYVVAYSCKGNSTLMQEKQMNKDLILNAQETTGDMNDIKSVCRKILNKAATQRLISRQETCVLLGDMPLTLCSEFIETVSISSSVKLKVDVGEKGVDKRFHVTYQKRDRSLGHLSMHEFFFHHRKEIAKKKEAAIPHYVGLAGYPTFPVTKNYAMQVLTVYKPWIRERPSEADWKSKFDAFIKSDECPVSARMQYDRVVQRYFDGTIFVEPTAKEFDHSENEIIKDDEMIILLCGLGASGRTDFEDAMFSKIHKGLDYPWDAPCKVCLQGSPMDSSAYPDTLKQVQGAPLIFLPFSAKGNRQIGTTRRLAS